MCWNADISINTFGFSIIALIFIYFTNTFTKYKTKIFDNPIVYLLFLEISGIQLVEYFLWKNINNQKLNNFFSILASIIIIIQPPTIMLLINNVTYRNYLLISYLLYLVFFHSFYYFKRDYSNIIFTTSIGKKGHLSWDWMNLSGYENIFTIIFLLFYVISLLLIDNNIIKYFGIILLVFSLVKYLKDKIWGSMWCWFGNFILLYFIIDILLIKPFYEYNRLC
jgi:hypothetical protein